MHIFDNLGASKANKWSKKNETPILTKEHKFNVEQLEGWARYYRNRQLWVCPHTTEHENFYKRWKNVKDDASYNAVADTFNWRDAEGIYLITGKKGAFVITVPKDENEEYRDKPLSKVLRILRISEDYEWIIESRCSYDIIIDICLTPKGNLLGGKTYRELKFLWEDYYQLPTGKDGDRKFKNTLPQNHPRQYLWKNIQESLDEIDKIHLVRDQFVIEEERLNKQRRDREKHKEKIKEAATGILCLITGIALIVGIYHWSDYLFDVIGKGFLILFAILITLGICWLFYYNYKNFIKDGYKKTKAILTSFIYTIIICVLLAGLIYACGSCGNVGSYYPYENIKMRPDHL